MSQEMSVPMQSLPAAIAQQFKNVSVFEAPVSAGVVFPRISINKRMFSVIETGADPIVIRDAGGRPVDSINVVVIGANPGMYKTFYPGKYTPGAEVEAPKCFSTNGVVPHAGAAAKQAPTCAECPHNVFGSKITENGKKAKACSDSKRLLVLPWDMVDGKVYMLNVSATALKGWNSYIKLLQHHGIPSPAAVATHVTLNEDTEFPQLQFSYVATLDASTISTVLARTQESDVVEFMEGVVDAEGEFAGTKTPEAPAVVPAPAARAPEAVAPAAPAAKPAPVVAGFGTAPPKAAKASKAKAAPTGFGAAQSAPAAAQAAPAAPVATASTSPLDQAALDALVDY